MPIDRDNDEFYRLQRTYTKNEITKWCRRHTEKYYGAVQPSPEAVRRVRRVLFGPNDPDENTFFLEEQVRQLELIEKERWGFDFKGESPLPGYAWEEATTKKEPESSAKPSKTRRQTKLTDYLPRKKTADAQKKLKMILNSIRDEDLEEMQVSS